MVEEDDGALKPVENRRAQWERPGATTHARPQYAGGMRFFHHPPAAETFGKALQNPAVFRKLGPPATEYAIPATQFPKPSRSRRRAHSGAGDQ
jgi:hypothetical protein